MKNKKRNAFWTFLFSFGPGCAEMYWGYMQMGMSLLVPFALAVFFAYLLDMPELLFLAAVIYVYAFFHARNMAHMTAEEVAKQPDGSVQLLAGLVEPFASRSNRSLTIWGGVLLIIFGGSRLLDLVGQAFPRDHWLGRILANLFQFYFPKIIAAVAIIVLGIYLIRGKLKEVSGQDAAQPVADDKLIATENAKHEEGENNGTAA